MKCMTVFASMLLLCACSASAVPGREARQDLYVCEGCEAAFEVPAAQLEPVADVASPDEPGDRLVLAGTVFQADGRTPVRDVVVYMHQTNAAGSYAGGDPKSTWSHRHGRLRAWVKTGSDGRYRFNTVKPGPYPGHTEPAHIHLTVLEPGRPPYFVDDVVFRGETRVTPEYVATRRKQGGGGVIDLIRDGEGFWLARRDIVLEPHLQK